MNQFKIDCWAGPYRESHNSHTTMNGVSNESYVTTGTGSRSDNLEQIGKKLSSADGHRSDLYEMAVKTSDVSKNLILMDLVFY